MRKDIIVGIDPGTTKGYALLDLEGNLLKLNIPAPKLVRKIATATGARIIHPEASLDTKRKRKLTSPYGRELKKENLDKHKLDSLAAANYAFKRIRSQLEKIKIVLNQKNKSYLEKDVTSLVITKNISIHHALQKF
ncbi:DUF460 domain-containing protein [Candidatus Woesearchaeota archaeon]|nr:DUF460 domain-containing protein [Candidatus Woesearchaeota archaeon]